MAKPSGEGRGQRRAKGSDRARATGKKKKSAPKSRTPTYSEADVIDALNHLVRRQILRLLHEPDGPRSPVRCAEKLGRPLSNVAYHFKVLCDQAIIAPNGTAPARGATEHFYASMVSDNETIVQMLERIRKADEPPGKSKRRSS